MVLYPHKSQRSGRSPEGLAKKLSWGKKGSSYRRLSKHGLCSEVVIGCIAERPALLIAINPKKSIDADLHDTARLAYHTCIEWGILANDNEAILFNALHRSGDSWYHLPPVEAGLLEDNKSLFSSLTPESMLEGSITDRAFDKSTPDDTLSPVDDTLVTTLDHWRDEALRYADFPKDIDDKIQTLFSQFFILRSIEDRGLAPNVPSLKSVVTNKSAKLTALDRLFKTASKEILTDLFCEKPYRDIPPDIVASVIDDLYCPRNMPIGGFRYNFAWIESDVLGQAYQKYLSTVLSPVKVRDPQQWLFSHPKREVNRVSVQKAKGVYYTPDFVVKYLSSKCIDEYLRHCSNKIITPDKLPLPKIADPSCGSGSFLVAAVDILLDRLKQINHRTQWGRRIIRDGCISGIDVDSRAVTLSRLAVWLRLAQEPNPLPLPELKNTIRVGDSLAESAWQGKYGSFDIILGNPPFVAHIPPERREALAARFPTVQGRGDLSYLFLELSCNLLNDNGILGLVMPNRLFSSRDASPLRDLVTSECNLLTVIDFGSNEVFAGTTSYIALITAQKCLGTNKKPSLRFITVHRLHDIFPAWVIQHADHSGQDYSDHYASAHNVDHPTGPTRWLFLSDAEKSARVHMQEDSSLLGDIAVIRQGIKTGANDVFVVRQVDSPIHGKLKIENSFGDTATLETHLLHPVAYGSDIQVYRNIQPQRYIIYPYRDGRPIPASVLTKECPLTFHYFKRYQALLERRSSISTRGKLWYELAEKRDTTWLDAPKLLIRELAQEPSFAIDSDGTTYLIGGTAISLYDNRLLLPVLAYLNSKIVKWYLSHQSPQFRDSFQKYEPETLAAIPIPEAIVNNTDIQDRLGTLVPRHD